MGYASDRLWLDSAETERDERIGEHDCFITLFDQANDRYLGNSMHWSAALEPFLRPEMREVVVQRFRVVPRCHCDQVWCPGEEWAGSRHPIVEDTHGVIDFDATQDAAVAEWRGHVEQLRASVEERLAAAARRRGGYLVTATEFDKLDTMEKFGAVRTARAVLDGIELEAVITARREGRSWTEIGVQMGVSKQAARERFIAHDPQGAEAA